MGAAGAGQTTKLINRMLCAFGFLAVAFPAALAVRVGFAESRDDGAPEFPMILAISCPDLASVDAALASPVRGEARAATESVLARFFSGGIHHHVTTAHDCEPA